MQIPKNKRLKSTKITQSAKGEECTLRIYGVCNFNPETTIFAHCNGAGMALKSHDIHGLYVCSSCHDLMDGRTMPLPRLESLRSDMLKAMIETQSILIQKGLIKT